MHTISVIGDRPDFRVFVDLLFGAEHNVDSDGNSCPFNSRAWTCLYISDRIGESRPGLRARTGESRRGHLASLVGRRAVSQPGGTPLTASSVTFPARRIGILR